MRLARMPTLQYAATRLFCSVTSRLETSRKALNRALSNFVAANRTQPASGGRKSHHPSSKASRQALSCRDNAFRPPDSSLRRTASRFFDATQP